jgi:hypothetical protein
MDVSSNEVVDLPVSTVTDTSGNEVVDLPTSTITDVSGGMIEVLPPPPIRLEDILGEQQLLVSQESADKTMLESIGTISYDTLKPRLIQWAASGFPNAYTIYEIAIRSPPLCSDGVARSLQDYIEFVSGKSISDHVAPLQTRLPDFVVSFAYSGHSILIVVSKSG